MSSRDNPGDVGVFSHDLFRECRPTVPRPYFESFECPERVGEILRYWQRSGFTEKVARVDMGAPPAARTDILRVHSRFLYETVERLTEVGSGEIGNSVLAAPLTLPMAAQAAGCTITAVRAVLEGDLQKAASVVRPPGHHATRETSDGLCVFNNIAIAIEAARAAHLASRFAIIDVDAHYGDGLAQVYYEDPDVLYVSLHEMDFGQGERGTPHERGRGRGKGFTLNFPVPLDAGHEDYLSALTYVLPVVSQFAPDVILVATGFDGHYADPIGNLRLTTATFARVGELVGVLADECCEGRLVYCLEGGYNLLVLPVAMTAILAPEAYHAVPFFDKTVKPASGGAVRPLLSQVRALVWELFGGRWDLPAVE